MYNISFKAYKNKDLKKIHQMINTSAWIWNHIISLQKRYYKLYGKFINVNKLQKHIAKLRNKNPRWKELNSQSVQELCQRSDDAYKRFFKKLAKRPPKFKKAKNFNSFVLKQSGWKIKDNVLTIGKVNYKFSKSREYENVKRITVKRNKLGEIFFIICCDMKPVQFKRVGDATIGMYDKFTNSYFGTVFAIL
jgi:putative transposase